MTKKYIYILGILLVALLLSSCKKEQVSFETFASSLALTDNQEVKGYEQLLQIHTGNILVYEESRILAPRDDAYQLTTQVKKRLNGLDAETQYSYDEPLVVVEVGSLRESFGTSFREEYFQEFQIDPENGLFEGRVKDLSVKLFLNDENFNGTQLIITINIDSLNHRLISYSLSYLTENGNQAVVTTQITY
jgi:hypothetical protein